MRIGELALQAGVTVKAVRYYEDIGLVAPERASNGYREYTAQDLRTVREVRELHGLGIAPSRAAPFVECLDTGHEHGDECVSSLAVYRDAIAELDRALAELGARREALQRRLDAAAGRGFSRVPEGDSARDPEASSSQTSPTGDTPAPPAGDTPVPPAGDTPVPPADFTQLPAGLPVPEDDGAAAHLPGMPVPPLVLGSARGELVDLAALGSGRTIIYLYPLTGTPGVDLPEGWDAIPGARGCSTEACDFRDHFTELREAGAARVYGFSSQSPEYQAEVVDRLGLPFTMLSDPGLALADALDLPTFAAPGHDRLYARLTLVIRDGVIEHAFYPIFPPNAHAQQVLAWLTAHPENPA
ncbi:redoxin family protein [Leucobacter luti]|uniref:Peroxiredoxin n=1 Tax=Leucobacter luti TaxID=340320 RepID=A0A4Q7TUY5_9MICO|nr:redoxin family protein [Leucobacter luti]MBL3698181.1 MerR family DNA-binding transcriptional regulator [Leucobacter luti]RZT64735.1 peroxiredoxin [Leucobacter luti]